MNVEDELKQARDEYLRKIQDIGQREANARKQEEAEIAQARREADPNADYIGG